MQRHLTPLILLATLAATANAHATLLTYSFTGATTGSQQHIGNYHWDAETGYSNGPNTGSCSDCVSGGMSFTVDASRYADLAPSDGYTYDYGAPAVSPWLNSASTISGPLFSDSLATSGDADSYVYAYSSSGSGNQFYLRDYLYHARDFTYDDQGRVISYLLDYAYNAAWLAGALTFGLVDGQELPTAATVSSGTLHQVWLKEMYTYHYDAGGTRIQDSWDVWSRHSYLPLASLRITSSDALPAQVPEPAPLGLLLAGFMAWWPVWRPGRARMPRGDLKSIPGLRPRGGPGGRTGFTPSARPGFPANAGKDTDVPRPAAGAA